MTATVMAGGGTTGAELTPDEPVRRGGAGSAARLSGRARNSVAKAEYSPNPARMIHWERRSVR